MHTPDSFHGIQQETRFLCLSRRAFSLVEILVSIAVIVVLAAILIPAVATVRGRADSAKCAANLKQVGQAIQLYAADNGGRLPGPIYREQSMLYQWRAGEITHQGHLISYLAPYLEGGPRMTTGSGSANIPAFLCPAWVSSKGFSPGEVISRGVAFQAERRFFGVYNPDPDRNAGAINLGDIPPHMRIAALWETDAADGTAYGNTGNDRLATGPVHGTHRHYLFLDGSVLAVPLAEQLHRQELQDQRY